MELQFNNGQKSMKKVLEIFILVFWWRINSIVAAYFWF